MIISHFISGAMKGFNRHVISPIKPFLLNNLSISQFSESEKPKPEHSKFFVPPPREPYNEKDHPDDKNTYVPFTKALYYKLIGDFNHHLIHFMIFFL